MKRIVVPNDAGYGARKGFSSSDTQPLSGRIDDSESPLCEHNGHLVPPIDQHSPSKRSRIRRSLGIGSTWIRPATDSDESDE